MNTCYYSKGSKHECCTHQHYCIFNENRWNLEKQLMKNWREYSELKRLHNSYLRGDYHGDIDYDFLMRKIGSVRQNISRLTQYRTEIIEGKVKGYGYELLDIEEI